MGRHRKQTNIKKQIISIGLGALIGGAIIVAVNNGAPAHNSSSIAPSSVVEAPDEIATVRRVIDGDTFVTNDGDGTSVRILGIDSCENSGESKNGGREATEEARLLLPIGTSVKLKRQPGVNLDIYDRALRYVELPDGRDYGSVMVVEKHTGVYAGENDASPEYMAQLRGLDYDGRDCN